MKILLDTSDVKQAIREFTERSGIIKQDAEISMDIVKLRTGDDIRIEITVIKRGEEEVPSTNDAGIDESVIDDQGDDDSLNPFSDKLSE